MSPRANRSMKPKEAFDNFNVMALQNNQDALGSPMLSPMKFLDI